MSGLDGMTQYCRACVDPQTGKEPHTCGLSYPTAQPAAPDSRLACPRCQAEAQSGMVSNYRHAKHTCTPDAPRAALPAEVEAALVDLVDEPDDHLAGRIMSASKIRAHLHHLTAEVERLRANGAAKLSTIHALCDTADEIERQARLDALRWVCSQAMCADWRDLGERIKAEIARLEQ